MFYEITSRMLSQNLRHNNEGVATDEAILIGVMVASVGTFGVVATPWNKVGDAIKGKGTLAVERLTSIETANEAMYDTFRKWPHELTNGSPTSNAAMLLSRDALRYPYRDSKYYRPQLKGSFAFDMTRDGAILKHAIGVGGRVLQTAAPKHTGYRMRVVMEDVPFSTAQEIDIKLDGHYNPDAGRVTLKFNHDRVDVIYLANKRT